MNKIELDTAAALLANWQQKLGTAKNSGALTEAQKTEEIVLKLAHAGLRIERQKLAGLAEAAQSLRLTEVVPNESAPHSQLVEIRETTGAVRLKPIR